MTIGVTNGCVLEDSAFTLLARVEVNGSNVLQADLTSIAYRVYNVSDPGTLVDSGTLTVSSVIFDTLQTDGRWSEDTTGYNFKSDLAETVLTTPGRYRIEHTFTPVSGSPFELKPFEITVESIWGS